MPGRRACCRLLPQFARPWSQLPAGERGTRAGRRGYGAKTVRDLCDPRRPGEAAVTEHPNVELTRRGYDAFAKGDLAALAELIADDVTWHAAGAGPLSGTY